MLFGVDGTISSRDTSILPGRGSLKILDAHLADSQWLERDRTTIDGLAVFPLVAPAHEGEISLDDYSQVHAWISRIKKLPAYVEMPGSSRAAALRGATGSDGKFSGKYGPWPTA